MHNLSEQQLVIAAYWAQGMTKAKIAKLMVLSFHSINNQIRRIYEKLKVHSKFEFLIKWMEKQ